MITGSGNGDFDYNFEDYPFEYGDTGGGEQDPDDLENLPGILFSKRVLKCFICCPDFSDDYIDYGNYEDVVDVDDEDIAIEESQLNVTTSKSTVKSIIFLDPSPHSCLRFCPFDPALSFFC